MYVIFPAEDVVELTFGRPEAKEFQQQHHCCKCTCNCSPQQKSDSSVQNCGNRSSSGISCSSTSGRGGGEKASGGKKFSSLWKSKLKPTASSILKMMNNEPSFKDLSHPTFNDQLKAYNTATFKLVRTVSDFSQDLSRAYEDHANNLQNLVTNYRKKNADLRKERPSCNSTLFQIWETLLQEVEIDSQAQTDIASVLSRQVSRPLLDRSFHRKVQARKIFGHRDSFEIIVNKAEEKLTKCRQDYKIAYLAHLSSNTPATLANYIESHNTYVKQLHAVNAMVEQYSKETLPLLLQELEDVYTDLCNTVSDSVHQGAEIITSRTSEQCKRYENISVQCRSILPNVDMASFVKYLSPLPTQLHPSHRLRVFIHPQPANTEQEGALLGTSTSDYPAYNESNSQLLPKNELVTEHMHPVEIKEKYDNLRTESVKLETQIKQLHDSLDALLRIQQKSLESSLFNKANELQEDISIKRYDLRMAQIQLAAIQAQRELFGSKLESMESGSRDRKLSAASSNASMKSKWLKAFKSLKTSPTNGSAKDTTEKKNGREGFQVTSSPELVHQFQEYTYKKITPCDVCSQVLRGHTRQGLKCRLCKMNVHLDCQEKVSTKCQTKSRLLRRQKSTSEIETRIGGMPDEEGLQKDENNQQPFSSTGNFIDFVRLQQPSSQVQLIGDNFRTSSSSSSSSAANRITAPDEPPRKAHYQPMTTGSSRVTASLNVITPPIASSSEQIQYAAGTRPFGQPLMLSRGPPPENGEVVSSKSTTKSSSGAFSGLFRKHT